MSEKDMKMTEIVMKRDKYFLWGYVVLVIIFAKLGFTNLRFVSMFELFGWCCLFFVPMLAAILILTKYFMNYLYMGRFKEARMIMLISTLLGTLYELLFAFFFPPVLLGTFAAITYNFFMIYRLGHVIVEQ